MVGIKCLILHTLCLKIIFVCIVNSFTHLVLIFPELFFFSLRKVATLVINNDAAQVTSMFCVV